jgi:hypothetical protein
MVTESPTPLMRPPPRVLHPRSGDRLNALARSPARPGSGRPDVTPGRL